MSADRINDSEFTDYFYTWGEAAQYLEQILDNMDNYDETKESHYSACVKFRRALSVLQFRLNATVNQDVRRSRRTGEGSDSVRMQGRSD